LIADGSPDAGTRVDGGARPKRVQLDGESSGLWDAYWNDPCDDTRNLLVVHYQGLAREVSGRFAMRLPRSVDRGDLLTASNMGLMSAIKGFDPERGVRFESYAEMRIRGALIDELRAQDWLPRPWRQRVERHKRSIEKLRSDLGRDPRDEEVAQDMGLPLDEFLLLFGTRLPGAPAGSMGEDGHSDETASLLEVVPDQNALLPGEKLTRGELLKLVAQKLTEQEHRIVYLKYWEELPMREIGELTGLSESRVCKIHSRLIERLQDRLRSAGGE
jgi:RNA polymerase sigma factor for flagellar operon FliA